MKDFYYKIIEKILYIKSMQFLENKNIYNFLFFISFLLLFGLVYLNLLFFSHIENINYQSFFLLKQIYIFINIFLAVNLSISALIVFKKNLILIDIKKIFLILILFILFINYGLWIMFLLLFMGGKIKKRVITLFFYPEKYKIYNK
jgi:hypothetical protein